MHRRPELPYLLRTTLKLEVPIVDIGTTDPTVTETRIPWLLHNFPDDRQQGYTLADYVFKNLKLKRIGVIRTQTRYARIGRGKVQRRGAPHGAPAGAGS